MKKLILTAWAFACVLPGAGAQANADFNVVPLPEEVSLSGEAPFVLDAADVICSGKALKAEAAFLSDYVAEATGIRTKTSRKAGNICLSMDKSLASEEYHISVRNGRIDITGGSAAGVFYGVQTLRKSLPVGKHASVEIPAGEVKDSPRFGYRGMHLDCARHFFSVGFVKEYIDILALHNMNVFHWHLTDDQGWRIEIKALPELTKVGSVRAGTVVGNNSDVDDGIEYGGFYTQKQIKDIVAYAAARHIEVIPEIDVPGHASAILACHPELGCTGGPYHVARKWGVYNDVLCVGNPKTIPYLEKIFAEVAELFPSRYIHIGGDETPTVRWEACLKCQAVDTGGKSLQGWFTDRIESFLASKGKTVIGWDEMLERGADNSVVIMSWRGTKPGLMAAEMGHDVIMTPVNHAYFDYYQTGNNIYEPSITGRFPVSVETVYSMEPAPDDLSEAARAHIKGAQANLWTEYIASGNVAEYMLLPRLAALSEVNWTPAGRKDFDSFKARVTRLTGLYDFYGWHYAVHLWPERVTQNRWYLDNQ